MQIDITRDSDIKNLLADAKTIGIIPSKVAGPDCFCAGAALYHLFKTADKTIHFIYPGKLPEGTEDLVNTEDIIATLAERDLLVSVDYSGSPVDKVRYNTENNVLTFRLGPIPSDFDIANNVHVKIASYNFDVCFVLGAQYLDNLGGTYNILKEEIHASKIVNIDNSKKNSRFGIVNMIETDADSLCHVIFQHVNDWELNLNKQASKALLTGMTLKSENLIS